MNRRAIQAYALALALAVPEGAPAQTIVSLNMCTDQLLLELAAPAQIKGLSPYGQSASRAAKIPVSAAIPILSGTAEEVMLLRPDLVIAGLYDRRSTQDLIKRQGIRLETFDIVRSVKASQQQVLRLGEISGTGQKAGEIVQALESGLSKLRQSASGHKLHVLPFSRRGWIEGTDTILGDLLRTAGVINAAGDAGLTVGGFLGLEAIIKLQPDALVISQEDVRAEDQGSSLLLHPAIRTLFPPNRLIVLPESLTLCGGLSLLEAMERLGKQLKQLKQRVPGP